MPASKRKAPVSIIADEPTRTTRRSHKIPEAPPSDTGKQFTREAESPHELQPSYEDIRRRNIAKIQLEMQHIGLSAAAAAFTPTNVTTSRSSFPTGSRGKKSVPASEPLRMSLRARDGRTTTRDIYSEAAFEIQEQRERMQRRSAPFNVEDAWFKDLGSSELESRSLSEGVFAALRLHSASKSSAKPKVAEAAECYGRMRTHLSGYGKLVPDRIYSICMHPGRDSIIGFAGDKFGAAIRAPRGTSGTSYFCSFAGKLGVVNYGSASEVMKDSLVSFSDGDAEFARRRVCLEAHKETISCITFPPSSTGTSGDATACSVFTVSVPQPPATACSSALTTAPPPPQTVILRRIHTRTQHRSCSVLGRCSARRG